MTREEIKKAIENGDSVWVVTNEPEILDFKKINKRDIHLEDGQLEIDTYYGELSSDIYQFEEVFKTKAEAEHYLHHANVSRIEHLPFLTWEEFKEKRELKFNSVDCKYCELFIFNGFIYLQVGKDITENSKQQNVGEAIEENFYKAYDECVALFRDNAND